MAIAILGLSHRRLQNSTILRYTYYVFSNASYIAPCRIYFFYKSATTSSTGGLL